MSPDDPRHGTQAGRSQHYRDNEPPCAACVMGDILAGRRRRKRRTLGQRFTLEVGPELHQRLTDLRDQGATFQQIADWSGVSFRTAHTAIVGGPEGRLYAESHRRLSNMRPGPIVTAIGLTRRVRALQRRGYSMPSLAAELGISPTWMRTIRDGRLTGSPSHDLRRRVVALYERLQMQDPDTSTPDKRKGVTRARNAAERNDWPPPFAWDDIDDPDEIPTDWRYVATDRREALRDLADMGLGITEAARRLHLSRDAVWVWCKNHGMGDVYRKLAAREALRANQHSRGAVA